MEVEGIGGVVDGLIGSAEAEEIRRDHAMARGGKDGEHLSVEVAPGRFAMKTKEGDFRVLRAFVARELFDETRGIGQPGEHRESLFGGAEGFGRHLPGSYTTGREGPSNN